MAMDATQWPWRRCWLIVLRFMLQPTLEIRPSHDSCGSMEPSRRPTSWRCLSDQPAKIKIILNHINNLLKRLGTDQAVSVWCAEHLDCNLDSENKRDKCRSVVQLETQAKSQQLTVTSCCFRLPAKVTGRDCGERILSSIANFVLVLCVKGCLCWPHRRRLIQLCLRHSWLYWLVSPASKGLWDLQWPAVQSKCRSWNYLFQRMIGGLSALESFVRF